MFAVLKHAQTCSSSSPDWPVDGVHSTEVTFWDCQGSLKPPQPLLRSHQSDDLLMSIPQLHICH